MIILHYLRKKGHLDFLQDKKQMKVDILSGLTVALALIPEAIAFSFFAKVNPMVGLWAAFIIGGVTALFGGRPGMISGATGAMAVVMTALVVSHGVEFLFAAIILAGIIQIVFGICKLGKLVRIIPHSVMLGFVNGLAIIIFLSQVGQFKVGGEWLSGSAMIIMVGLIILTMFTIHFFPKVTKIIPSGLLAIVGVTLLVMYVPGLEGVRTVADFLKENGFSTLEGGFPKFHIPVITMNFIEMLKIIVPYSLMLSVIGLTESLMTLTLIDELTETKGDTNKESIAQGLGNTICGFFGAMGGCAMIGQSMINISNGGRRRLSGVSASFFLILFVVFGTGVIVKIPLAALVGLMFMVVIGTFAWPTLKIIHKVPKSDAFVTVVVTFITVYTGDLAIAVISGIIISALVFAWKKSSDITAEKKIMNKMTYYTLHGPLFFGSISHFKELFIPKEDKKEVIIDFLDSKVMDHSALDAIDGLTGKYKKEGKKLHLIHLSPECKQLLENAKKFVEVNVIEDPKYFIADI